jgi:hypothetical protein
LQRETLGGETVPCVAGWGGDGALEAVTEFGKEIDESPGESKARCRKRSIARSSPCSWAPAGGLSCRRIPARTPGSAAMTVIMC